MVALIIVGCLFFSFFVTLAAFIYRNRILTTVDLDEPCEYHEWFTLVWSTGISQVETIRKSYNTDKICKKCGKLANTPFRVRLRGLETILRQIMRYSSLPLMGNDAFLYEQDLLQDCVKGTDMKNLDMIAGLYMGYTLNLVTQKNADALEELKRKL